MSVGPPGDARKVFDHRRLEAVRSEYQDVPAPKSGALKFSVVVCAYNAAATIEECLHHATSLEYQDYEVIVIDDGSRDDTAALAAQYPCRVVSTENRGLGAARTLGLKLSTGDVVAYLDRPEFAKFWANDAKAVVAAVNSIGMVK